MKQYVLSNKYELRRLTELLPQGAMIRVLRNSDITRVGNIVVLTSVGSKDEDDLVLEVAPAEESATDTVADEADGDIDGDIDDDDGDTADTPSDEEEGKDCYW